MYSIPSSTGRRVVALALDTAGCSSWQSTTRAELQSSGLAPDIRVASSGNDAVVVRDGVIDGDTVRSATNAGKARLERATRLEVRRPDPNRTMAAVVGVGIGAVVIGVLAAVVAGAATPSHASSGETSSAPSVFNISGGL